MRCLRPQVFVRQCRVVKRHEYVPKGFERMTKELTASTPSAVKIKVVTLPDNIALTVGAKTRQLRGTVVPAEDQRAARR